jgi:hypothetical protein
MNRLCFLAFAHLALCACGDVRYGVQNVPIGQANSDAATTEAIQHALAPADVNCKVEILELEAPQGSANTFKQVAKVKVCGQTQKYSVQHSQTTSDRVLITATRI